MRREAAAQRAPAPACASLVGDLRHPRSPGLAPSSAAATSPDGVNLSIRPRPLSINLSPCASPELRRGAGRSVPSRPAKAGLRGGVNFEGSAAQSPIAMQVHAEMVQNRPLIIFNPPWGFSPASRVVLVQATGPQQERQPPELASEHRQQRQQT